MMLKFDEDMPLRNRLMQALHESLTEFFSPLHLSFYGESEDPENLSYPQAGNRALEKLVKSASDELVGELLGELNWAVFRDVYASRSIPIRVLRSGTSDHQAQSEEE